jgi:hypothetical protein
MDLVGIPEPEQGNITDPAKVISIESILLVKVSSTSLLEEKKLGDRQCYPLKYPI